MADALTITERPGLAIASVMARKGVGAAAIGEALGLVAPTRPAFVAGTDLALLGTGPGTWLAMAETDSLDWADGLQERLSGLASITDQSSSYVVTRLSGSDARRLLRRGLSIDLHPDAFGPGSAATSVIAHIGVIVWQVDDAPTYDLAVFRSLHAGLRHWIEITAASNRAFDDRIVLSAARHRRARLG